MVKGRFRDLPSWQQRTIGAAAAVQFTLLAAALTDIWRRPQAEIRGPKRIWSVAVFINFAGPVAYFLFGRARQAGEAAGHDHP